ncbi:MAG: hypothetical protein Q9222_001617 [Ikaeria aurantiellina]
MPFELRTVTSAHEVPEIVEQWLRYEVHTLGPLSSVNWGSGEDSYKDRVEDLCTRRWCKHMTTPGAVWLKVIDTERDDKVIAASQWNIYTEETPKVAHSPPTRAYWLAPGPERRFMEACRNNSAAMRADVTRPKMHMRKFLIAAYGWSWRTVDLETNFTSADYRRQGVNSLMLEWGKKKADELGLELWLEATPMGSRLYAKHGFGFQYMVDLYPSKELREDSIEWRHWEEVTKNHRVAVMKRPVNGVWKDGDKDAVPFPACDMERNIWLKG